MAGFTLTALSLLLAGAGTATSAYGQVKQGRAAKQQGQAQQGAAESEAQLSDYNASVADLQAIDAEQRGEEEASRYRAGVRGIVGEQRTGFAASGVEAGSGSALDVQADAAFLGELDALTVKTNAAREAWGYKVQATDLRKRAEIQRKEGAFARASGDDAARAAKIGAATTLIGGGASLLETSYGYRKKH